jgi:hypothetical protein
VGRGWRERMGQERGRVGGEKKGNGRIWHIPGEIPKYAIAMMSNSNYAMIKV